MSSYSTYFLSYLVYVHIFHFNTAWDTNLGHQRDERHREEINPQLEILREIEQYFQNQADNGRDDPRRDPNNMMLKQLSGKVAEFFHHGRPMPPSKKMEIVDLIRLWMEESKDAQKEFCRYQVFEFLFDFTHNRNDNGRLELLFSLISFSISTSSQENLWYII